MVIHRFDVFLVNLDPTRGREIRKRRPCLIIAPDEINRHLATTIVAPMTTRTRAYPSRIGCRFKGKVGEIALDQIRAVDRSRLIRRLGRIDTATADQVLAALQEMFAP